NLVFNRYLDECDEVDGLALLPFFMSVRATIRAHVMAEQALQAAGLQQEELVSEAKSYAALALYLLVPEPVHLVAIGGLSGTGKSTVAAAIAHEIGPAPGARILASDRIRKHRYGVSAETRLPVHAYQLEVSEQVYATLAQSAGQILAGGHAVVADAVFDRPGGRERIERIASDTKVGFTGIWLYAEPDQLFDRVDKRTGDPSDATAEVLRAQLVQNSGQSGWFQVYAGGTIATTLEQCRTQTMMLRSAVLAKEGPH
ncbi:MAG: AAA family ATPase, partial [Herbaspirillum sp.]